MRNILFDHINIVVGSRRNSRGGSRSRMLDRDITTSRTSTSRRSTPVILHLLIQFLLRLLGPGITPRAGFSVLALATTTTGSAGWRTLSGDVSVDILRGRLGDVAATVI
jgi:hypothetical protein